MPHFALTCPDAAGHVLPIGAIGCELQRRGHRVTFIARAKAAPLVAALGLTFHELKTEGVSPVTDDLMWTIFGYIGANWVISVRCAAAWDALVMLLKLPPLVQELGIDGVIADQVFASAATAAERAGVPCVHVCSAPPWNVDTAQPPSFTSWSYKPGLAARLRNYCGYVFWRWYIGPTLRIINRYRRSWGLSRFARMDECYSPLAQISQFFPEFDFPRRAAPKCFHYVGALTADHDYGGDVFPWERLDGRPIVYASLGTVADPMNRPVYPRIAAACQGLPVQLVMARGKWEQEEGGREETYDLPGDPIVVDFAPQLALLDRAAVMITHAGLNTVLGSISRGVPMVALPRSADQPGNAARIAYSGAGLCAPFHRGTPEQLRGVIEQVLNNGQYRRRAVELCTAMRRAGGVARAADIAEQALLTRQPVRAVHA
jgi:UDP:flavonoid glycosyltransferase YjiC (YdhE family)